MQSEFAANAAAAAAAASAAAAAAVDDETGAAKDDEGLSLRRATRQRAKARVAAICDVVAITHAFVQGALQRMDIPDELHDAIE
jgi:hypothetical protein